MPSLAGIPITSNGLGLMRLTQPGHQLPDKQTFAVLKAALAAGVNVWNGADFYGPPSNNSLHLMNRYFSAHPEDATKVVFSLKTGVVDIRTFKMDVSPSFLRESLSTALQILDGKKKIDLFGPCRAPPTPDVTIEDSVLACAESVKEGKIGGIQLSEVGSETIRRAAKAAKIEMVEVEASLWSTEIFSNGVVETCAELGIVIEAHTPLGAGMLTGKIRRVEDMGEDHHKYFPRWQGENFQKNLLLVKELEKLAEKKGCTTAQLALSWLKRGNGKVGSAWIVPIFGARSEERIKENCMDVEFSDDELSEISKILESFPVVGTRYPEPGMKFVEF
ncbi:Aldo/keto reductase [Mollisia scopiformis]|uniref:Aldo/keto reductase n=1 Tax=Mollisia scopiformis TaxID=149040 RepID=A0A194WVH0_MOLSC|nr:Aldo/keto reductase [Mollisia scopiformis]KUJ11664.1 Aldo/keto reductase [Mollisia scopiformis]